MPQTVMILGKEYEPSFSVPWIFTGQGEPFNIREISVAEWLKNRAFVPMAFEERKFQWQGHWIILHMAWAGNAGVGWYEHRPDPRVLSEVRYLAFGCHHHYVPEGVITPTFQRFKCEKCGQEMTIDSGD